MSSREHEIVTGLKANLGHSKASIRQRAAKLCAEFASICLSLIPELERLASPDTEDDVEVREAAREAIVTLRAEKKRAAASDKRSASVPQGDTEAELSNRPSDEWSQKKDQLAVRAEDIKQEEAERIVREANGFTGFCALAESSTDRVVLLLVCAKLGGAIGLREDQAFDARISLGKVHEYAERTADLELAEVARVASELIVDRMTKSKKQ